MSDNEIGLKSVWDNRDFNKGQEQYSRGISAANKETEKFNKSISSMSFDKIASGATSIGKSLTVGLTLPLVAAGAAGIKAFSDLNEAVNASNVTFGSASQVLIDYANTAAESVGLSKRAFLQASVPIGAQLQNMGYSAKDAADWTVNLTQRAADMASVFNTDVNSALEAVQSGLRGEVNPLERFGVGLSAAAVQAYAVKNGLVEAGKEMTDQVKLTARLGLLMEQTARVQGDFANTSEGLANATRIAKAQLEDAAATLGEKLIPFASKAVGVGTDLIDMFNELSPAGQDAAIMLAAIAAGIGPALMGVGNLITAYQKLDVALKAANISTKAFLVTAGAWVAIIASVVAVGIVAYDTYKKVETAADNMQTTFTNSMQAMAEAGATQNQILEDYIKNQKEATQAVNEMGAIAKVLALITQDQIKNYEGLNGALAEAGGSYDEYRNAMIQAAIANGDLNEEFVRTKGDLPGLKSQIDSTLLSLGAYTKEQYNAIVSAKETQLQMQATALATNTLTVATNDMSIGSQGAVMAYTQQIAIMNEAVAASIALAAAQTAASQSQVTEAQVQFAVQGRLQEITENYADTMGDLTKQHQDLLDEKKKLISQGYSPEGKKVKELDAALEENAAKQLEAQEAADEATRSLIYQTAMAGLDGDAGAQLELARALRLVSEEDYNLIKATEAVNAKYKETGDLDAYTTAMTALYESARDGKIEAAELKAILDAMDGKVSNAEININTNYSSSGGGSYTKGSSGGGGSSGGKDTEMRAGGGPVSADTPYIVGEKGPELFIPSSAGEIMNNTMTDQLSGGNPFASFTDIDFSIFDTAKNSIEDAIRLMVDAGNIGEDEGEKLYQSLIGKLQNKLAGDAPITEEFIKNLTGGLDYLSEDIAAVTLQQEKLAAEDQKVLDAEKALEAAREAGAGEDEAQKALELAEQQRDNEKEKLDLLERQLDALKEKQSLEIEIRNNEEEAIRKAKDEEEKARKELEDNTKKRLEDAQKDAEKLAEEEKKMAEKAEIDKAQSAIDNAKSAVDEIEKLQNKAQVNRNSAIIEYNRLLRSGASKEELDNQLAKISASEQEIALAEENKTIANDKLLIEQENLSAIQKRIEESSSQKELEDFENMKKSILDELEAAMREYNRVFGLIDTIGLPPSAQPGDDIISKIGGGQSRNPSLQPVASRTLNMPMTNNISNGIDLAVLQNIIRQTVRQEFA